MEALPTEEVLCKGCQTKLVSSLFCFSCHTLQRLITPVNYFKVFGFPVTFSVDLTRLEAMYEKLATELHPDFHVTATPEKQKQSQLLSAVLNQAYETLKNPSTRAAYLLELLSKHVELDARQLPEGFLADMFETQETLDEALGSPERKREVQKIGAEVEERLKQVQWDYSKLFIQFEVSPVALFAHLQTIQTYLNTERYLQRLLERCSVATPN